MRAPRMINFFVNVFVEMVIVAIVASACELWIRRALRALDLFSGETLESVSSCTLDFLDPRRRA